MGFEDAESAERFTENMEFRADYEREEKLLRGARSLMPAEVQKEWDRRDAKERELCESLRTNCYDALGRIADAMRSPRVALSDLDEAIAMLTVARDCAKALDQ